MSVNSISNPGIPPSSQGRDALPFPSGSSKQAMDVKAQSPAPPDVSGGVPSTTGHVADAGTAVQPTKEQVNQVLEGLIKRQEGKPTSVHFSVDEKLGQVVIKVVDPATQKVIKQIPSEAIMKMREDMLAFESKSSTGLLLSEKT